MLSEEDFRIFASRLLPGTDNLLGVRLPLLRRLAKRLLKEDWRAFLAQRSRDSFEEIMLRGMVIGYVKVPLEEKLELVREFIPDIENWSVCDSFVSGLKIAREYPEEVWEFVKEYAKAKRNYDIRFGLVMMLNYYVEDRYLTEAFGIFDNLDSGDYYVKMAAAWAVSIYYIKYPKETMAYLKNSKLDDWTYNKALQKITESKCVGQEEKERVKGMRRTAGPPGPCRKS